MGCLAFLQRIFLTQGSHPNLLCLLHCQTGSLPPGTLGYIPGKLNRILGRRTQASIFTFFLLYFTLFTPFPNLPNLLFLQMPCFIYRCHHPTDSQVRHLKVRLNSAPTPCTSRLLSILTTLTQKCFQTWLHLHGLKSSPSSI